MKKACEPGTISVRTLICTWEVKMKAVVLAGGKGARLAPYTKILPKPLMPIGDMPILEVILRQLRQAGVTEAVLTVGHLSELLRTFFQDGARLGLNIQYSYEECPLGTAGPIAFVPNLDETFLVMNGDVLSTLPISELIQFHKQQKAIATIAAHHRQVKIDLESSNGTATIALWAISRSHPMIIR